MKTALRIEKHLCFLFFLLVLYGSITASEPEGEHSQPAAELLKPRNGLPNISSAAADLPVRIVYLRISPYETAGPKEGPRLFQKIWKSSHFEYISAPLSESGSRLLSADLVIIETAVCGGASFEQERLLARSLEEELRLIWRQKNRTDLFFLYTCSPEESFDSPGPSNFEYLADFYGIPSLDLTRSGAEKDPLSAIERSILSIRKEEESPSFPGRETVNRTRTEKAGGPPVFQE